MDGRDYRIDSATVSIATGEMSKLITIDIIEDDITECNETFKLTLSVSACGVVSGRTNITEVTIKDKGRITNDCIVCCSCDDQQK